jgi:hypothetical protein
VLRGVYNQLQATAAQLRNGCGVDLWARDAERYLRKSAQETKMNVFLALVTVLAIAGQPTVDNSPKARLQRIKDECEKTHGVNSSQSVDCFITRAKRMAAQDRRNELDRIQQRAK